MKKQSTVTERTKRKLIDSFWELYKDENEPKITIGRICEKSGYDRTTFYRYFLDMSDITNKLEDEIINSIKNDIKNSSNRTRGILTDGFRNFTNKYGEYISVYFEKRNKSFCEKFKALVIEDLYDYFRADIKDKNKKEFVYEFIFSSLINSYIYWLKHQDDMSLDEFITYMNNILQYISKTF